MATQNPIEMEGTYPLPEAQLDRFLLKALVPFPSADELVASSTAPPARRRTVERCGRRRPARAAMVELTRQVPVAEHLTRHAVDLVVATHPDWPDARVGQALRPLRRARPEAPRRSCWRPRPRRCSTVAPTSRPPTSAPWLARPCATASCSATKPIADGVTADDIVSDVLGSIEEPNPNLRGAS